MSVDQLLPLVRQHARLASEMAYAWMFSNEVDPLTLAEDLPALIAPYTQLAALLASDWYNSQDSESRYFAMPFEEIPLERCIATAQWVFRGPQRPENRIKVAAHSMVFDAARNTVWSNAELEGVAVARHEKAQACEDCAVAATTRAKARNSGSEDVVRDFHHSCEGMFVPVRGVLYEPPAHARVWGEKIADARRAGQANVEDIAKWLVNH